jgi:large subunit ribosomal protein L6
MSRVANNPVELPSGVDVKLNGQHISVKGAKGELAMDLHGDVEVVQQEGALTFVARSADRRALAGTTRALVSNMVTGVSQGFERRLQLQGVGYRAQASGKTLNLQLGFSHPVEYKLPDGIDVATPSQTEIVVSGVNKQLVGQVSAEIRAFRPPEPYKGKGVRYAGERVRRKEAKKK